MGFFFLGIGYGYTIFYTKLFLKTLTRHTTHEVETIRRAIGNGIDFMVLNQNFGQKSETEHFRQKSRFSKITCKTCKNRTKFRKWSANSEKRFWNFNICRIRSIKLSIFWKFQRWCCENSIVSRSWYFFAPRIKTKIKNVSRNWIWKCLSVERWMLY